MAIPGAPQIGVETVAAGFAADFHTGMVIVGAGACGMVAALAARERGADILVVERDAAPSGSTALSAGLIPAAGTRFQRAIGIDDDPETFAADIQRKAHGENDPALVESLARGSASLIEWLSDRYDLPFSLVADFDYPGHSHRRMHGLPSRSGRELVDRLRTACEDTGIDIITERRVTHLHADVSGRVAGVTMRRPDGVIERVGCDKLVLACNGFGGNSDMVRAYLPDIADALYFGHGGNQGEAMLWGEALGARIRHPGAYQGHGNVAHPHGILITWAVIGAGGFQIDRTGRRFWNEAQGYSEAARAVLARPGGEAFSIFDERIAGIAAQFADFRDAQSQGAIREAATIAELAQIIGVPRDALEQTFDEVTRAREGGSDVFGRDLSHVPPLAPPYRAVRVTGALFHTQGGLETDGEGRVRHRDGGFLPNLRAAGGAACGVSGTGDAGYLSGNGLLAATVLGRAAGTWRDA
ncbi:MAG: fumarate reductase flavoprotein subunit [Saliniramus fredricksonii]|uniref:Fumarate reductase flavoprotein subunit n=1 Tax=Saliniramus fredricksonii TaxID=1653334 RepID=A0A0P7XQ33_9HYPH|nr:MAG: fumarate reductase flavoprotein subunit [Saliniramus fredricksonii]SCC78427.1 fumarate reductase flavoprotein subunit [Saliniramus fredricksonii]